MTKHDRLLGLLFDYHEQEKLQKRKQEHRGQQNQPTNGQSEYKANDKHQDNPLQLFPNRNKAKNEVNFDSFIIIHT